MGGGSAGWISALYFLNKSKEHNLNLKIKLISSNEIGTIGVGEGTTPIFTEFINNICKISEREFLKETKGSFKFAIKFDNWNFDNDYYYHQFSESSIYENIDKEMDYKFIQYAINENLNIPQKILQKKLLGCSFDLLEKNKISLNINSRYSYHFSASLLISFLRKKCLKFENFYNIEGIIDNIYYDKTGFIEKIKIDSGQEILGDFFVNCLGFKSNSLINQEYFDIQNWDNYILNNSAFAIQVKNTSTEVIEPYTTSTAQEYGWSWKIPQYEKTGYGYVYSDHFIDDEDKLYNSLLKTYNIKEKNVFKTRVVKSKPYYNKKQLHKNCLSLGLASGFVEPLEATSIHMTLTSLNLLFDMIEEEIEINQKYINVFNSKLEKRWKNVFKFIIYHYFTNNPINDYWKHYKNIQENEIFDFSEKYQIRNDLVFSKKNYFDIGLGMKIQDYYYTFLNEKYLKEGFCDYLNYEYTFNCKSLWSHKEILNNINQNKIIKSLNYN